MAPRRTQLGRVWQYAYDNLNWFRIHLLVFTIVPFFFSGLFVAANPSIASGKFRTDYLDALFMCYSAMSMTGLYTVSLSALQPGQQSFLFVLMILGDISVVNLITVGCRQLWLKIECPQLANSKILRDRRQNRHRLAVRDGGEAEMPHPLTERATSAASGITSGHQRTDGDHSISPTSRDPVAPVAAQNTAAKDRVMTAPAETFDDFNPWSDGMRRRQTLRGGELQQNGAQQNGADQASKAEAKDPYAFVPSASSGKPANVGRGGFPTPQILLGRIFNLLFPAFKSRFVKTISRHDGDEALHTPQTFREVKKAIHGVFSEYADSKEDRVSLRVKWLPSEIRCIVVGRNSKFFEEELDEYDLEILGSLEYRATKFFTILLIVHQLFWMFVPAAIVAIYFAKIHTYDSAFQSNGSTQAGSVHTTWFSFFQIISGYSSSGLSLVDTGMVPFQTCFLLQWILLFPLLSGNQLLPFFLRAEIWLASKFARSGSEYEVCLNFALAHSRRFFLYVFPLYQTIWLVAIELFLMVIGVLSFVAFDVGTPYYRSLGSGWEKVSVGLMQSVSSRASGFSILSIQDLAPATNFLYLLMMFTSNYALAMAIRSTNVYEERALGIHGEHAPGKHPAMNSQDEIFSRYLKHHLLPQIYFDLWPIALGTLFICVMERGLLESDANRSWVDVFTVLFEATSAYTTVGFSYGNVYNSSSLTASFRQISKLIIILLMLRGRHRGLPLAIDRAVMFPKEYLRISKLERERILKDRVRRAEEMAD